jgi:transposase
MQKKKCPWCGNNNEDEIIESDDIFVCLECGETWC